MYVLYYLLVLMRFNIETTLYHSHSILRLQMGAQRFTDLDRNLLVAATDFPDDDRSKQANPSEHYSKSQPPTGIYGIEKVYIDRNAANEDIQIFVARR